MKNRSITVQGTEVAIATRHEQDYISLTDMVKRFDGGGALIEQWLKNKDTVLFLGVWEQLNNPGFNSPEFEGIRNEAGRNSFFLSAKKWIDATGAIGLHAKAGRYGGTYAHRDIAFEFGSWLIPEFKLYLEQLQGGNVTGGVDELLKYIKLNVNAIKTRAIAAPIIVVLDWDAAKKQGEFEKVMDKGDAYKVLVWPDTTFNPKLGKAFHGIERHISDRIVDEADASVGVLGTKADGSRTVSGGRLWKI